MWDFLSHRQSGATLLFAALSFLVLSGCASVVRFSSNSSSWRAGRSASAASATETEASASKILKPSLFPRSTAPLTPIQRALLEKAKSFIGSPYCYGGNGPQCVDCSGFTSQVFGSCGFVLPRTAMQQSFVGRAVDPGEASAGDLVFFSFDNRNIEHVGMYAGAGTIIHASKSKGVVLQSLETSGLLSGFREIRRVIGSM